MNPALRTLLWIGAGLTLLATVAALALLWWLIGGTQGHFDIRFNGAPLSWPDWQGWQGWSGGFHLPDLPPAFGAVAAMVGALLMLVAVPAMFLVALLLGALFSAMGVAGVLLAVALLAALALSPLWLVLAVHWLLLRRARTQQVRASP